MTPSEAMNMLRELQDWIESDYDVGMQEAGAIAYGLISSGWVEKFPEGWEDK